MKLRFPVLINMGVILLMYIVNVTPLLNHILPNATTLMLFALWLVISFPQGGSIFSYPINKEVICLWIILLLLEILWNYIFPGQLTINAYLFKIPAYCMPLMTMYVINRYNAKEKEWLIYMFVFIAGLNIFENIKFGLEHPGYFEMIEMYDDNFNLGLTNAGGSTFVNMTLFFIPICYILGKNMKRKWLRYALYGLVIASVYYISSINTRATAFFCVIFLCIAFLYVLKLNRAASNNLLILFVVCILLVTYGIWLAPTLRLIETLIPSERLVMRIDSVISTIERGGVSEDDRGSLYLRFQLAMLSLSTWLDGPINIFLGIGNPGGQANAENLFRSGIGQHSQIIDYLGKYGLLGFCLFITALKTTYRFIIHQTNQIKLRRFASITYFCFIIMSVLNNTLCVDNLFIIFLLLPLTINYLSNSTDSYFK